MSRFDLRPRLDAKILPPPGTPSEASRASKPHPPPTLLVGADGSVLTLDSGRGVAPVISTAAVARARPITPYGV